MNTWERLRDSRLFWLLVPSLSVFADIAAQRIGLRKWIFNQLPIPIVGFALEDTSWVLLAIVGSSFRWAYLVCCDGLDVGLAFWRNVAACTLLISIVRTRVTEVLSFLLVTLEWPALYP